VPDPAPRQPGTFQPLRPGPRPLPAKPRKVRGGVRLPAGDIAPPSSHTAWASQRWLRLIEQAAVGQPLVEGLEYARLGQAKRLEVTPGQVAAAVQGRAERPYTTTIALAPLSAEQWEQVVLAMSEGAIYAAKLLSGELPPNIEDIFGPLGLKLFPTDPSELKVSCNCAQIMAARESAMSARTLGSQSAANGAAARSAPAAAAETVPAAEPAQTTSSAWCKHICCVAYLIAHKLASEPFLMFTLRGMEGHDLLERLRQRRTLAGAAGGNTPVYPQRVPGVSDAPFPSLEESIEKFWDAGPGLEQIDLPLSPPPVSHPLLRRLGPSPFTGAQFPLVGLLASCYDVIGEKAQTPAEAAPEPVQEGAPEPPPEGDDESP
jgi:uncharacterized Zn finger protein